MSERNDTLDWCRDCPEEAVSLISKLEEDNERFRKLVEGYKESVITLQMTIDLYKSAISKKQ